jgi:hypothetical protein
MSKHESFTTLNSKTDKFSRFTHFQSTQFISDPFAWQLASGRIEVLGVDTSGDLESSSHLSTGAWTTWSKVAPGIDPCPVGQLTPECPGGNGTYCGGHGVGGTVGTLYDCAADKLTLDQLCPSGCQSVGAGGHDVCKVVVTATCNTNADCVDAGVGTCSVCAQPSQQCGGDTSANYCSTDVTTVLGQTCDVTADCDPCNTGALHCVSCPPTVGRTCNGNCCQ